MGSAFYREPLPPGVSPLEVVVASLGDPGQVVHHRRSDCPIEYPHAIVECGCFDHGPSLPRLGETITVRNRPALVTSVFRDGSYDVVEIPAGMSAVDFGRRFFYSGPTLGIVYDHDTPATRRRSVVYVRTVDGQSFGFDSRRFYRNGTTFASLNLGRLVVVVHDFEVGEPALSTLQAWRLPVGLTHVGMLRAVTARLRVTVDGVDVSARCLAADDRYGWATVYAENLAGQKFPSKTHRGVLAMEILTGTVRIEER